MKSINTIYLCAGNKGGTGKSMVATALIDAFLQRGAEPFVIETDDANPDVFKAHSQTYNKDAESAVFEMKYSK